jgi:hypothetical protein
MIQVFSSGGGTQSCAIAVLIVQGKLPKPDFAVIADTGFERSTTWAYQEQHVAPALASVGVELVRVCNQEWQSVPAHGKEWLSHNGNTVLLPAFTNQSGETGKLSGFCSARWKVEVRDRYLSKVHGITRSQFCVWIGFSIDEYPRAARMMKGEEYKKGLIKFPLIDRFLKRRESIKIVTDFGWPMPPRSACYMCPNQSDYEWLALKLGSPEEFQKAVELEREVQKQDPFAWFHQSCVPLDKVNFSQPEDLFTRACDSGACFI